MKNLKKQFKDKLYFISCDLSFGDQIKKAFDGIKKLAGSLDVLVNNAGTSEAVDFANLSLQEWERVIRVNLTGTMLCTKYATPLLSKGGSIVNVSSVRAEIPGTSVAYAASKAGIVNFTKAMSKYLGDRNIRVNCVIPGPTKTAMVHLWGKEKRKELIGRTKLKRMASPEEIAEVIAFLASGKASYITGAVLRVDGGFE